MCVTCPAGRIAKRPAMSIRPIRLRPANGNPKVLYKSEIATYPARIFYLSEICIRNDISKDIKYRAIKLQQVDRASIFPPRLTWLGRVDTCIRFVKKRRSASSEEGAKGCWYAPGNPVPWPIAENGWKPSLSLTVFGIDSTDYPSLFHPSVLGVRPFERGVQTLSNIIAVGELKRELYGSMKS